MSFPISKTHFLAGLHCPKRLWLSICKPEDATPASFADQQRLKQGEAIGQAAREVFPDGVLIDGGLKHVLEQSWEATVVGVEVTCLFEPAFIYDDILVRCDILRRLPSGHWEIVEVKSATKLKDEHIADLTLQHYVLEGIGLTIEKTSLMVVNPTVRNWNAVDQRFLLHDITTAVVQWRQQLPHQLHQFRELLKVSTAPEVAIGSHCDRPHPCPFKAHCWQDVPAVSVLNIPRLNGDKLQQLLAANVLDLRDIDPDFPLSVNQWQFVERMLKNQAEIDFSLIQSLLSQLEYPLYFFDVETYSSAIPRFAGLHPYERCVFQYSCHRLDQDGHCQHFEYLHTENSDPRLPLLMALLDHLGDRGSVVVYNLSFEKGVLQQLAATYPAYATPLHRIIDRLWDLQIIFKKAYFHPGFQGSCSLKKVLPVLVPGLSHGNLAIQSGNDAPLVWAGLLECTEDQPRLAMIDQLRQYCQLDTWGMVEIYRVLQRELRDQGLG
ncbi:MAG: DUF2779 domain-containing protein [Synechocystis sp.]|nr:DUF2779 domain-containing protein [Synechocystis sp.]